MSDPFELRLIFSNRLKALNPCEDNADEVVGFALKHRELAEDFHSCILEQLENVGTLTVIVQADFDRMRITSMSGPTSSTSWRIWLSWPSTRGTLNICA